MCPYVIANYLSWSWACTRTRPIFRWRDHRDYSLLYCFSHGHPQLEVVVKFTSWLCWIHVHCRRLSWIPLLYYYATYNNIYVHVHVYYVYVIDPTRHVINVVSLYIISGAMYMLYQHIDLGHHGLSEPHKHEAKPGSSVCTNLRFGTRCSQWVQYRHLKLIPGHTGY